MNNLKITIKSHPVIFTFFIYLLFFAYQKLSAGIILFDNFLLTNLIFEALWAAIIVIIIYYINGSGVFKFSTKGFGFAFKLGWWVLLVHLLMGIYFLTNKINSHAQLAPNLFIVLIEIILFLLCVGIFEEGLFRGLFLSSFLAKDGNSFKGLLKACLLSSLLFGIAHIFPDIINLFSKPETNTLMTYLQMVGKTLQTGVLGFVLAVIYLGNHNFWSIALIHSFVDACSAGINFVYQSNDIGNYINSSMGWVGLIIYAALILIILPADIYAYFQLKHISLPQWGLFKEPYEPLQLKKVKISKY